MRVRSVEFLTIKLMFLFPNLINLLTMLAPIKPAPPVIRTDERVIIEDMIDIICAICGEKQQIKTLYPPTFDRKNVSKNTYSARRLPDKVHYRIVKCLRCSLIFSSPIISLKEISKFYKDSLCNYEDQIPYLIKTYLNIIKNIWNKVPKNPKVLEVGCGNGFFLKALLDSKFTKNIFGVEPSSKMVLEADSSLRNKIKISIFKSNMFAKESFDLILCFHTLDHMYDPNEFIRNSYSMLKRNGYVIIVVHDTEGLSVKLFGENSAIFDIEHIYLFNKRTLKLLFTRNKFNVVKIFNLINNYPLRYWITMSGIPLPLKKIANFFIGILGISRITLSIPAGNIGIIAKKS